MTRARIVAGLLVAAALAAAASAPTFSRFTSSTSNANNRVVADRIFPRDRVVPAWNLTDASGSAVDDTEELAFNDARYIDTSNASSAFASNRWYDVELADLAPAGLTPTSVTAEVDFSDDNGDGKTTCMYLEARRISTDAVIGTHGTSGSPLACEPDVVAHTVSQSLPEVTSTTIANDLKLRLFFSDEGNNAVRIHRVVVKAVVYGKTWTLLPVATNDALDTVATGTTPWQLGRVDATAFRNASNWPASYNSGRYLSFTFPATVPGGASVTSASLENVWKTANGVQHCMFFEVYSGGSLLATHGSTGSPWCTTSSTVYATDTISLSEINTPTRANDVTVKAYYWGGNKIDLDRTALHLTWRVGPTGCVDSHTETVAVTADTWNDQNAPTSTTGGTNVDLKIRTDTARNRRAYVYFPLPTIADDCTLTAATLRLYQNSVQGTRTIDAYQAAAAWTEAGLSWNTRPGTTGSPASASAATANAWVQWTVTSLVQGMYSGTNNGFVLKDSTEDAATAAEQRFNARETGSNPGQLVLTYG
jgi:hypothetical protein